MTFNFVTFSTDANHLTTKIKVENQAPREYNKLVQKYKDIFEGNGKLVDHQANLYIDHEIQPVYQKRYRQPYHLRKSINKELKRLEEADIIEDAPGPQDWVSNIVATPKADGNVRLCLDARVTRSRAT